MENIDNAIVVLAEECAAELALDFVACSWQRKEGQRILEVLIDKKGGISLNDISEFTDLLSPQLDKLSVLDFPYVLDCASPGAERFVAPSDVFNNPERYRGEYMEITTVTGVKYLGTVENIDPIEGIKVFYFIKGRRKNAVITAQEVSKTQLRVKI